MSTNLLKKNKQQNFFHLICIKNMPGVSDMDILFLVFAVVKSALEILYNVLWSIIKPG